MLIVSYNTIMRNKSTSEDPSLPKPEYFLYLLLCKGNVIYTGITTDVARRFTEHCAGKGAKFTRSRPPSRLLCQASVGDRSNAQKVEYAVKQLPRARKLAYVQNLSL
jgi:putative endonuclease